MTLPDSKLARVSLPLPPKAQHLPLVGSLPYIIPKKLDFLIEEHKRLGDLFTLDLGFMEMILVCHPRHAQHVFRDHSEHYGKSGAFWAALGQISGNGLVSNIDHEFWLRQRRMMRPHFHRQRLAEMSKTMVEAIDRVLLDLDVFAESGQTFDINHYLSRITMYIILGTLFGAYLKPDEIEDAERISTLAFSQVFSAVIANSVPAWLPVPGKKAFQKNIEELDVLIYRVLERCRADQETAHGLIGMLMDMVDTETNEQMTDLQLRDEAVTMFLAGYETTATTLGWTLHFMNQNPEVQQKAYAEVDAVLGDRAPTFADLPNLNYLYRMFQETLRMRAPGYWIPRYSVSEDVIDGYRIPANKMFFVMVHMIHHHPDFWDDPLKYEPDRFLPENVSKRNQFSWIPFGVGQRQCIGRDFALMEAQLILARLFQRYRFHFDPDHQVTPYFFAAVQRPDALRVRLEPRQP